MRTREAHLHEIDLDKTAGCPHKRHTYISVGTPCSAHICMGFIGPAGPPMNTHLHHTNSRNFSGSVRRCVYNMGAGIFSGRSRRGIATRAGGMFGCRRGISATGKGASLAHPSPCVAGNPSAVLEKAVPAPGANLSATHKTSPAPERTSSALARVWFATDGTLSVTAKTPDASDKTPSAPDKTPFAANKTPSVTDKVLSATDNTPSAPDNTLSVTDKVLSAVQKTAISAEKAVFASKSPVFGAPAPFTPSNTTATHRPSWPRQTPLGTARTPRATRLPGECPA